MQFAAGDARKALNLIELIAGTFEPDVENIVTNAMVVKVTQNIARYDKSGEQHYDLVSAFIKSIGEDPDATLYWIFCISKVVKIPFYCRRMLIAASEDIGNSNPNALLLAEKSFCSSGGHARVSNYSWAGAVYLATSAKVTVLILRSTKFWIWLRKQRFTCAVAFKKCPTKLMKEQGYGVDYLYPHNYPEHFVMQEYLPLSSKEPNCMSRHAISVEVEGERLQQRRWQTRAATAVVIKSLMKNQAFVF